MEKYQKYSLRPILKTLNNLFVFYENKTENYLQRSGNKTERQSEENYFQTGFKKSLMELVENVNSPGNKDYQTFDNKEKMFSYDKNILLTWV